MPFTIGPGEIVLLALLVVIVIFGICAFGGSRETSGTFPDTEPEGPTGSQEAPLLTPTQAAAAPATIVRTYRGRQQADAAAAFQRDAERLAQQGYFPVSRGTSLSARVGHPVSGGAVPS